MQLQELLVPQILSTLLDHLHYHHNNPHAYVLKFGPCCVSLLIWTLNLSSGTGEGGTVTTATREPIVCLKVFLFVFFFFKAMMWMYRFVLNKLNMGIRAFSCPETHYHLKSEILTQIQPKISSVYGSIPFLKLNRTDPFYLVFSLLYI